MYRRYLRGETFLRLAAWMSDKHPEVTSTGRPMKWNHNLVARFLDRGFAAGLLHDADGFHPGAQDPIISQRTWQAYQEARRGRQMAPRRPVHPGEFCFDGLLRCVCGSVMVHDRDGEGQLGYRCVEHSRTETPTRGHCRIRQRRVVSEVLDWCGELGLDVQAAERARAGMTRRCTRQWAVARALAKADSAADEPGGTRRDEALRLAAELESLWFDPAERASALIEDWKDLSPSLRRQRVGQ